MASFIGNSASNRIAGTQDADVIRAGRGDDVIFGVGGHDLLYGEHGNDVVFGGLGNDQLEGGLGADRLAGDAGDDTILGGVARDILAGGAGDDVLLGGQGDDTIHGGVGNDILHGNNGADTLDGGVGDDVLYGGTGFDTLIGGSGFDTVSFVDEPRGMYVELYKDDQIAAYGNPETGLYKGGPGNPQEGWAGPIEHMSSIERVRGSNFADTIWANHFPGDTQFAAGPLAISGLGGNDHIQGSFSNDQIEGNAGDDFIYGSGGNDKIWGGGGNDTLVGGSGNDQVTGGDGSDRFACSVAIGNAGQEQGNDILTDFTRGADLLSIRIFVQNDTQHSLPGLLLNSAQVFQILDSNNDSKISALDQNADVTSDGLLIDLTPLVRNGISSSHVFYSSVTDNSITLLGVTNLTASDII